MDPQYSLSTSITYYVNQIYRSNRFGVMLDGSTMTLLLSDVTLNESIVLLPRFEIIKGGSMMQLLLRPEVTIDEFMMQLPHSELALDRSMMQ